MALPSLTALWWIMSPNAKAEMKRVLKALVFLTSAGKRFLKVLFFFTLDAPRKQ